jgi:hypothetical protein
VANGEPRFCVAQAEAKSSKSFLLLFFKKEVLSSASEFEFSGKKAFFEKKKQGSFASRG